MIKTVNTFKAGNGALMKKTAQPRVMIIFVHSIVSSKGIEKGKKIV